MTFQPTYIPKQKPKPTGVGYDDELAEAPLALEGFESVLNHAYRVGFAPLHAHRSQSRTLDKKSGKPKVLGLRMPHMPPPLLAPLLQAASVQVQAEATSTPCSRLLAP
eukprot:9343107-Pyramimonas_sp.AAC.1